jgi:hypothetical protein
VVASPPLASIAPRPSRVESARHFLSDASDTSKKFCCIHVVLMLYSCCTLVVLLLYSCAYEMEQQL